MENIAAYKHDTGALYLLYTHVVYAVEHKRFTCKNVFLGNHLECKHETLTCEYIFIAWALNPVPKSNRVCDVINVMLKRCSRLHLLTAA